MRHLFLLSLLTFYISCSEKIIDSPQKFTLVMVDSITFEPLTTVNANSYCVKYHSDANGEYLFWGNRPRNSIEIFDINSGNHMKTIRFPREGPNSISNINRGFTILSFDSIFISNSELGKIFMFDTSAILQKVYNHTDTSYYSANNLIGLNSKIHSDIYATNENLIFPFDIPQFPTQPSDSVVNSLQVLKLYDIGEGRFRNSELHFEPEIYEPNSLFIANSNTMLDGRFFYQIATKSAIRYTDDFHNKKLREAKSKFHTGYIKMSDYASDFYSYLAKEFSYRSLFADPFRQVIYRTVKLPVKDILTANLDNEFEDVYERVSIMILDKDLNILGEQLFENSNYSLNLLMSKEPGQTAWV